MNRTLCLRWHRQHIIIRHLGLCISMLFCSKCQAFR